MAYNPRQLLALAEVDLRSNLEGINQYTAGGGFQKNDAKSKGEGPEAHKALAAQVTEHLSKHFGIDAKHVFSH